MAALTGCIKSGKKSTRLEFEYWKARPAHPDPNVCNATFNDTNETHLMTICSFNDSFPSLCESWQLLLTGCCHYVGGGDRAVVSLGRQRFRMRQTHVLTPCPTCRRSTLPCPTPVFEKSEEFISPKMALLEMKNKNNLDGIHQPRAQGFTSSKLSGILEQVSAYSSAHQAFLNRLWCFRTSSSHSLALLVTLFVAIPAITVSTWIIMCCLHFSFTPKNIHVDCKNTCYQRPFLPDQTTGKQGAVYSWPKQPDQDFHKINTRNPTCSNFIPVTREMCVQLIILGDQGASDVPFSGEAPCYRWQLWGSILLRHRSAYRYFSLDA